MVKVGIVGGTGYTGVELLRLLALHPEVEVNGKPFVMATHLMAAVPKTALQNPVANLSDHADDITRALDLLFQGY